MVLTTQQIREKFKSFFARKNHTVLPSAPIIPLQDQSLFFVNAGMVPLKEQFCNPSSALYSQCASIQKCLRAGGKHNDLDNVGKTSSHHTFFEMLGNFSFGSYGVDDAICLAYEFLTVELGFLKQDMLFSTLPQDTKTISSWKRLCQIRDEQLFTDPGNTWSMGNIGPTGNCTEIFLRQRDGSIVELWNIVMMTEEVHPDGSKSALKNPCIDTGAGLERIASSLQNKTSNYENDVFSSIKNSISKNLHCEDNILANVLADHLRALLVLSSEGLIAGNTGRGYILRRIIRRMLTMCYLRQLEDKLIPGLVSTLSHIVSVMSYYSELQQGLDLAIQTLENEYKRLNSVLKDNAKEVNALMLSGGYISGETAFYLHDTKGFPIDVLAIMAEKANTNIDLVSFEKMCTLRDASAKNVKNEKTYKIQSSSKTSFTGHWSLNNAAVVNQLLQEKGKEYLVLDKTVFFPESGGQNGDIGVITDPEDGSVFSVDDTYYAQDSIFHEGNTIKGSFYSGKKVRLQVDETHRLCSAAHHTSTHLTCSAVQKLDAKALVTSSQVSANRFRIDIQSELNFGTKELQQLESITNSWIRSGFQCQENTYDLESALKHNFKIPVGQKRIRVISFVLSGGEKISMESCCGTHVNHSTEIGHIAFISAVKIQSNVTRIIGVSGSLATRYMQQQHENLKHLASILQVPVEQTSIKVEEILQKQKKLLSAHKKLQKQSLTKIFSALKSGENKAIVVGATENDIHCVKLAGEVMRSQHTKHPDYMYCYLSNKNVFIAGHHSRIAKLIALMRKGSYLSNPCTTIKNFIVLRLEKNLTETLLREMISTCG